jgi:hypothetical protein
MTRRMNALSAKTGDDVLDDIDIAPASIDMHLAALSAPLGLRLILAGHIFDLLVSPVLQDGVIGDATTRAVSVSLPQHREIPFALDLS